MDVGVPGGFLMQVSWSEARSVRLIRSILAFLGFWPMLGFLTETADEVSRLGGEAGVWGGVWLGVGIAGFLAIGTAFASVPSADVYRKGARGWLTRAWRARILVAALVFVLVAAFLALSWGYARARLLEASGGMVAVSSYGGSIVAVSFLLAAHTLLYRLPGEAAEDAPPNRMSSRDLRRTALPFAVFGVTAGIMTLAAMVASVLLGSSATNPGIVSFAGIAMFLAFFLALASYAALAMSAPRQVPGARP